VEAAMVVVAVTAAVAPVATVNSSVLATTHDSQISFSF
jgi:hypothetical protein